jgi:hypothetical protein
MERAADGGDARKLFDPRQRRSHLLTGLPTESTFVFATGEPSTNINRLLFLDVSNGQEEALKPQEYLSAP